MLAFIAVVILLMAFDYPIGTFALASTLLLIPVFAAMWFAWRERIYATAAERKAKHLPTSRFPAAPQTDLHPKN